MLVKCLPNNHTVYLLFAPVPTCPSGPIAPFLCQAIRRNMAPVNLDYQVPWTPQFALNARSRTARRQVPGAARPTPLSDARGTYNEAVAVQPGLPAVTVASLSPNKPPRISSDPDLSLCVISGRDERPNVDLDVSESDNTLPPLGRLIESINKEQPKSKSSPGKLPCRRRLDVG